MSKVWASAAQHKVQINFDLNLIEPAEIAAHLAKAGYPTARAWKQHRLPTHKDPAWAESGLRMTETYSVAPRRERQSPQGAIMTKKEARTPNSSAPIPPPSSCCTGGNAASQHGLHCREYGSLSYR